MNFLISTCYRTTGQSTIWKLDSDDWKLRLFRQDQYYQPGERGPHDYIYWGMDIYKKRLYCVGGNVLSIMDLDGNLVARRKVNFLREAHDLRIIDGQIYCANTAYDTVEIFSIELEHRETIRLKDLLCFRDRKLLNKTNDKEDAVHVNFFSSRNSNVFVTHSFTCEQNKLRAALLMLAKMLDRFVGCHPFPSRDIVLNPRSGKIISSGGVLNITGERVIHGLKGAHDGIFYGDEFYVNATYNIETLIYSENFKLAQRIEYDDGMLVRGLCPISPTVLLVGATRIDPSRTAASMYHRVLKARGSSRFDKSSSVKVVDRKTGKFLKSIDLDTFQGVHPEVFKIIPMSL